MDGCRCLAVVYAKGHSERIPQKNLRSLGDWPLFWHITNTAMKCRAADKVFVDTDSADIAGYAMEHGVDAIKRTKGLETNGATGDDLVMDTAERFAEYDVILQLYPTSPFVTVATLTLAIVAASEQYNSATGIITSRDYLWHNGTPQPEVVPSQLLTPTIRETTGFYATRRDYVTKFGRRVDPDSCFGVELSQIEAIDIDYEADLRFAEIVWRGLCGA